ncbi:MAG TPA: 2Fe-2S iron-sulfur cluster-binding protein [Acidimicrobiia bacterium]|nr:2Fe-2S iron-sulfur cluster-binding protein [Acidimicrobiia bacterium]
MIDLTVDGRRVEVPDGSTLLDACRSAGSEVPTLCALSTLAPANACRACVVEAGPGALVPACSRIAEPGMEVRTDSDRVRRSRRLVFELLASAVELDRSPEIAQAIEAVGADGSRFGGPAAATERALPTPGHRPAPDPSVAASVAEPPKVEDDLYVRDYARCILCYRCVDACGDQHQNTFAITMAGRGFDTVVATEYDVALPESACVYCGNCIAVCPTGALMGRVEYDMRQAGSWDPSGQDVTRTICPYCGVGCSLDVRTQDGRIVDVTSPLDHDVTLGNLCVKGRFGWRFVHAE